MSARVWRSSFTCDRQRAASLESWFDQHARRLPWRQPKRRNGYAALVAEIMLQQTQVIRVKSAFERFIRKFPSIRRLAAADEPSVLRAWEGLGYYRRARMLHAAARSVVEQFGGRMPRSVEDLRLLPGVGRYTAGAIASLIHGARTPIVDGNVHRVICRWDNKDYPTDRGLRETWDRAAELVKVAVRPGVFNEAMMELGATICTPRTPRCQKCPVRSFCKASAASRQDHLPRPKRPADAAAVHHHAVMIWRGNRLLVQCRGNKGMWAGLWQVPTIEAAAPLSSQQLVRALPCTLKTSPRRLGSFHHNTTHRKITFHVYSATSRARKGQWVPAPATADLPMSNAQRRILREHASLR